MSTLHYIAVYKRMRLAALFIARGERLRNVISKVGGVGHNLAVRLSVLEVHVYWRDAGSS